MSALSEKRVILYHYVQAGMNYMTFWFSYWQRSILL